MKDIVLSFFKLFEIQNEFNVIKLILLFSAITYFNYSSLLQHAGFLPPVVDKEVFEKELCNYSKIASNVSELMVFRAKSYRDGIAENNLHLMIGESQQRATTTLLIDAIIPSIVALSFWTFLVIALCANYIIDSKSKLHKSKKRLLRAFRIVGPILIIIFSTYSGRIIIDYILQWG